MLSVITPTYNRAKFVRQAIDSVLPQKECEFELIIINDGSTDNTEEVLKGYGDKIRYFTIKNSGQAQAQNYGIGQAKGEYICFLDDDDLLYDDLSLIIRQRELIKHGVDFVWTNYAEIWEDKRLKGIFVTENYDLAQIWKRDLINTNTILYRREILKKYEPQIFPVELSSNEDWYFKILLFLNGKGMAIKQLTHKYRYHQGMRSNKDRQSGKLGENEVIMRRLIIDKFPEMANV